MEDQLLQELEAAAKIMLAPAVSNEQLRAAEAVILNFQKSKTPYAMCKHILETSTTHYVVFEAASTLKEAIIREWSMLDENDILTLRQYLMDYVINKPQLPPYVRERILQVIAIIVKRGSVNDYGMERRNFLAQVEQLLYTNDIFKQTLYCSMISAILQEYATTFKSSDVGLTWETHFRAKKLFEVSDLKRIFLFCVQTLTELRKLSPPFSTSNLALLKHLSAISETVLTWGFISPLLRKRLVGVIEQSHIMNSPSLRLSVKWKAAIWETNVIEVFFDLYWKIRDNPQIAHHLLSCLVQLASLNGNIFISREVQLEYLTVYLESFFKFISSVEVFDREAYEVASIIRNIVLFYANVLPGLRQDLLQKFFEQLTRLTCFFCEGAAQEESCYPSGDFALLFRDAYTSMLRSAITIFSEPQQYPADYCKQAALPIFNTYLTCHLAAPHGNRGTGQDEGEIDNEIDEEDGVKFRDHLQSIGVLGRLILNHALPLLAQLLEEQTIKLQVHLEQMHASCTYNNSQSVSAIESKMLESLLEDIHWLILTAGYVLTMEGSLEREPPSIPKEVIDYSIEQQSQVNEEVSHKVHNHPELALTDIPGAEKNCDHIIRLVAAVCRLCEVERKAVVANMVHRVSAEVGQNIVWFLQQWTVSYIRTCVDGEVGYKICSNAQPRRPSECGFVAYWNDVGMINFLLNKAVFNLSMQGWSPEIVSASVELLVSLTEYKSQVKHLLECKGLWDILEMHRDMVSYYAPPAAKKGLFKAFVSIGSGILEIDEVSNNKYERLEEHWQKVLKPLHNRLQSITRSEKFQRVYQDEETRNEIANIIECFTGAVQGVTLTTANSFFSFIFPILTDSVSLMNIYHNYQQIVELVLQLFYEMEAASLLSYLTPKERNQFYKCVWTLLQIYQAHNQNRHSLESGAEEDAYQDLLLLMKLLTALVPKDFFDLSPPQEGPVDPNEKLIEAADVCIFGLTIIMPFMTVDLLQFPTLCQQYYKMITYTCELYPEKFCLVTPSLLESVLMTIELGLKAFTVDICILCSDFLRSFGNYLFLAADNPSTAVPRRIFCPVLKLLMDLILSHQVNTEFMPNAGTTLYILICCYKEEYRALVQQMIDSQQDPAVAERLAKCFTELTNNVALNNERAHWIKFGENFEKFLVEVQGFLLVK